MNQAMALNFKSGQGFLTRYTLAVKTMPISHKNVLIL